jgi:hypothetical protein
LTITVHHQVHRDFFITLYIFPVFLPDYFSKVSYHGALQKVRLRCCGIAVHRRGCHVRHIGTESEKIRQYDDVTLMYSFDQLLRLKEQIQSRILKPFLIEPCKHTNRKICLRLLNVGCIKTCTCAQYISQCVAIHLYQNEDQQCVHVSLFIFKFIPFVSICLVTTKR